MTLELCTMTTCYNILYTTVLPCSRDGSGRRMQMLICIHPIDTSAGTSEVTAQGPPIVDVECQSPRHASLLWDCSI